MTIPLPKKYDIIGVGISATTYEESIRILIQAAHTGKYLLVTHLPVHGVVLGSLNPEYNRQLSYFDILSPDGQPVRFAMHLIHGIRLPDRVYGPEHMVRLCERSASEGISIYLYGSTPQVVSRLAIYLTRRSPGLVIAGWESPPFRPLRAQENEAVIERINRSGAGFVFIGLGCPLQDTFIYEHRHRIHSTMLSVGAAFDFLSENKKMAPKWMQDHSLEWLYRLIQEPKRLARRYVFTNCVFLLKLLFQFLMCRIMPAFHGRRL